MKRVKRITSLFLSIAMLFLLLYKLKDNFYYRSFYPNGNKYRVSIYNPFKQVFQVKQFDENGKITRFYHINKFSEYQEGEAWLYDKQGNIKPY